MENKKYTVSIEQPSPCAFFQTRLKLFYANLNIVDIRNWSCVPWWRNIKLV